MARGPVVAARLKRSNQVDDRATRDCRRGHGNHQPARARWSWLMCQPGQLIDQSPAGDCDELGGARRR